MLVIKSLGSIQAMLVIFAYVLLHNTIRFHTACAAISGIVGVVLLALSSTVKLDGIGVFEDWAVTASMAFGSVLKKKW